MSARSKVERIARWLYGRQCEVPRAMLDGAWSALGREERLFWLGEARAVIRAVKAAS